MPKTYSRKFHKHTARKFGKYAPNRFQASYGGNLQNKMSKRGNIVEVQGVPFDVTFTQSADGAFSTVLPVQWSLSQLRSAESIVDYWQQFRFLSAELSVRPSDINSSNVDRVEYITVAPHKIAGLNGNGDKIEQISSQFVKDLPGSQTKACYLDAPATGVNETLQPSQLVINSYCKGPVVAMNGLSTQSGTNSSTDISMSMPWINTLSGDDIVHNGFLISVEGTSPTGNNLICAHCQIKYKIQVRYAKPQEYAPSSLNETVPAKMIERRDASTAKALKALKYLKQMDSVEKDKFLDAIHTMC